MASASDAFSGRNRYSVVIITNQLSQNIPGNYSTVSVVGQIVETAENGSWSNGTCSFSISVNGVNRSGTINGYDFRDYNSLTFYNGSQNIGHNANGTKSYSFSVSVGSGTIIGAASASGSNTLSTIPRASTSTWAPGTVSPTMAGNTYTLNTNRASTSFTHTITYSFNGVTGTIGTGVGASINWTIPLSLINQIPNATRGYGVITTKTYSGGSLIGTTTSNFAADVPASVVPTWTSVSATEANSDVTTKVGAFVQGVSKVSYSINGASGAYNSTISSQQYTIDGQTVSGATGTTPNPISVSGTVPGVFKIVDSRGRQHTQTSNIEVLPYSNPLISSMTVVRALSDGTPDPDDGTYLRVTLNTSVSSLINGTQKNSITIRVYTKLKTATTWTLSRTIIPGGITYNTWFTVTGPFAVDKSYDVRVEVIDIFNTSPAQTTIAVAAIFMHWGNGLGVGKFHELGALDVNGDIYHKGQKVLSHQQTLYFESSGTFTKASYPWLSAVRVRLVGGGGAGGGSPAASAGNHSSGGGGGGGGYAESMLPVSSIPSSVTVTVGAGAIGPVGAGGSGGVSSFGTLVSATGGGGGGYGINNALMIGSLPGEGGVGTIGQFLTSGSPGGLGSGYATLAHGGFGGSSMFGGGARSIYTGAGAASSAGLPGNGYGGGGGGAIVNAEGVARAGGNGSPGIVVVELYS